MRGKKNYMKRVIRDVIKTEREEEDKKVLVENS